MAENEHHDLAGDIAAHGWIVMRVAADMAAPAFAYSIGMARNLDHPEIIVVGLAADTAHRMISNIGNLVRAGHRYVAGEVCDEVLDGYAVTFRKVPPHQYRAYLGNATRFYSGDDFPVLQLVYPDRQHRWPWDSEVSDEFRRNQPVLADEAEPEWARNR